MPGFALGIVKIKNKNKGMELKPILGLVGVLYSHGDRATRVESEIPLVTRMTD